MTGGVQSFSFGRPPKLKLWTPPTRQFNLDGVLEAKNLQPVLPKILPNLWILTTSASPEFLASFDVKPHQSWCKGFYFFGEAMNTAIVVLDELPETNETVWLRIFGKGKTQQQAIETLATLEDQDPLLFNVLDVFHKWHEDTKIQDHLTQEDKELLMILSPAYEKSRTQALLEGMLQGREQGIQQGIQQGALSKAHHIVTRQLRRKFPQIPTSLVQHVEATSDMEQLDNWLDQIMLANDLAEIDFNIPSQKT